jgi:hypothetical protein
MRRLLTLRGPGQQGKLLWDDEAGTFEGTDAADLNACAHAPVSHPAWPSCEELPAYDAKALIVLLHVFGWDVPPELAVEAAALRAREPPYPPDVVY